MEHAKAYSRSVEKLFLHQPGFFAAAMNDSTQFQAGAKTFVTHEHAAAPKVTKSPGSLTAADLTFTDTNYAALEFATEPSTIKNFDEFFTSFMMRNARAEADALALRNRIGTYVLTNWASAGKANLVLTTGSTARSASYGTGNRKAIKYDDLLKVLRAFSKWNIPLEGRFCVLSETMLADLKALNEFKSREYMGENTVGNSVVGRILGFDVYTFNSLPAAALGADSASTALAADSIAEAAVSSTAAKNTSVALFASRFSARFGVSGIKSLAEVSTSARANIITSYMYAGARGVYNDGRGIVLLAEGN